MVSLCVGLLALPLLLDALGAERLGVFTLALGLIGFSGLFDLGLGRALTQTVASALADGRKVSVVAALVWKVLRLLAAFGTFWMFLLWVSSPWIVRAAFSLQGALASETAFGLRALALSIPVALVAAGAMGAIEGMQQFRRLNLWRMPMSLVQFGLPLLVATIRPDVGLVIASLAFTRLLWMLLWLLQLRYLLPGEEGAVPSPSDLRHAFHFGGWLSVSNIVGPIMVYLDRFYLATQMPPAIVAHYTVPLDASFRATSLPQTAINALFPALAQAQHHSELSVRMFELACRALIGIALFPALLVAMFAHPLLAAWLGESFASSTVPIFKLLLIGIFFNSVAHPPYALIQAHGRSDITAKLHLLELPVFVAVLILCVYKFGVVGAAFAWSFRAMIDAILLYSVSTVVQPALRATVTRIGALTLVSIVALCVGGYALNTWVLWINALVAFAGCSYLLFSLSRFWRGSQTI